MSQSYNYLFCFPTELSKFIRFWNWIRGILLVIDYSGITTNSFAIVVIAIIREQAIENIIAWLFELLRIDKWPDFSKKNLFRILINIVDQTEGFEKDPTSDETCKLLTQYDNDGDTVTSEISNSTIGRER